MYANELQYVFVKPMTSSERSKLSHGSTTNRNWELEHDYIHCVANGVNKSLCCVAVKYYSVNHVIVIIFRISNLFTIPKQIMENAMSCYGVQPFRFDGTIKVRDNKQHRLGANPV